MAFVRVRRWYIPTSFTPTSRGRMRPCLLQEIVRISYATGGVNFYLRYTNTSTSSRTGIGSDTQFSYSREGGAISVGIYACLTTPRDSN